MKLIAPCGVASVVDKDAIAIDIDCGYLVKSKAVSAPGVRYVIGDLNYLPFRNKSFGAVNCWNVLEHLATKGQVVDELSRVSRSGADLDFSAGIRAGDQFLGRLSKNYNRIVTQGFHRWTAPSAEYIRLISKDYKITKLDYPCAANLIILVGLMDIFGLTVSEAAEWQGKGKRLGRAQFIANRIGRFIQPAFNLFKKSEYWRELLSQTVIIQALRK